MHRLYKNIGFLTFFGPHNFIFYIIIIVTVEFDKKFDYTYENTLPYKVFVHLKIASVVFGHFWSKLLFGS